MNAIPPIVPAGAGGLNAAKGAAAGAAHRAAQAALARDLAAQISQPPEAAPPLEAAEFPPEEIRAKCEALVERYPTRMAALLPILHVAQKHYGGWISPDVEAGVAQYLDLPDQHVRGVLTFYAMYHTEPVGRHEIWVCRTLSCWLAGAAGLARQAREKAGLTKPDQITGDDGRFTVMEMECLGLCEVAPAVFVDGKPYVNVTPEKFDELLDACE